jgi:hypothetical protein
VSTHAPAARLRLASCWFRRSLRAATHSSGRGSGASDVSVLTWPCGPERRTGVAECPGDPVGLAGTDGVAVGIAGSDALEQQVPLFWLSLLLEGVLHGAGHGSDSTGRRKPPHSLNSAGSQTGQANCRPRFCRYPAKVEPRATVSLASMRTTAPPGRCR